MAIKYQGGCQCGQIRYEITAQPLTIYVCHCKECQKQSSSAFGMSMPVSREAFKVIQGQPKQWTRKSDSGREVSCFFCGDCGTRLFHNPSRNPKITNIKPGTLDDTSWIEPVGHLWTNQAQKWVHISDRTLNFPAQPDEYALLLEKWLERSQ